MILAIGVLNFHPPHFLVESGSSARTLGSDLLEAGLLADVVAAIVAAVGIYHRARWGWVLGVVIVGVGVVSYLVQEMVGLPGLPRMWLEPSRIVALVIEAGFVAVAYRQVRRAPAHHYDRKT